MGLDGASILIVGGGSGIGFAVAEAARAEGAAVTIASTNKDKLVGAAERLDGAKWAVLDITDEKAVEAFFHSSGDFDHVVTTAGDWGSARRGPFVSIDMSEADALFQVRFWGAAILAKHAAWHLDDGGSITLTSGMSAFCPQKGSVMATAMAGSIEHLTYGLAVELAPIRVNAVFPGGVATEIFAGLPEEMRKTEEARFASQPLPRISRPEEVAQAYLYAMKATYTTGQVIKVDGGGELAG
ncbi:MAG: SDR family oxidoreductase [Novosphingobium sp.]|nr:SDR family oxidoreductase [Novosphingobium sp.]